MRYTLGHVILVLIFTAIIGVALAVALMGGYAVVVGELGRRRGYRQAQEDHEPGFRETDDPDEHLEALTGNITLVTAPAPAGTGTLAGEPAYSPRELLSTRPDPPDMTGPLISAEPVGDGRDPDGMPAGWAALHEELAQHEHPQPGWVYDESADEWVQVPGPVEYATEAFSINDTPEPADPGINGPRFTPDQLVGALHDRDDTPVKPDRPTIARRLALIAGRMLADDDNEKEDNGTDMGRAESGHSGPGKAEEQDDPPAQG
jgi:hypothetical protein